MSGTFLTHDELCELTDRKSYAGQKKCLLRQRITFVESADGRPRVLRSALEQRFGVHRSEADVRTIVPMVQPNFAAIRR